MPGFDADGDANMLAPPVYEFVKAPPLDSWTQPGLVVFKLKRRQYEEKMRERCLATGEVPERVVSSVKSSALPEVLDHVCRYILKKNVFDVTDQDLWTAINEKTGTLMNDHVPDVGKIVKDHLKMDLREADIEARVLKYYMDLDKIIEDHGLGTIIGSGPVYDEDGRQRMKARCKLLVEHLQPEMLRLDIERLVSLTHRTAKCDDIVLFDLVVERGRHQQHFHLMSGEIRRDSTTTKKARGSNQRVPKGKGADQPTVSHSLGAKASKEPPRDGCLHCGGAHWLSDCKTASPQQKEEARRRRKDRKDLKSEKVKMMRAGDHASATRTAAINDVLEVPLCVDTGADCNVVSSAIVGELAELDPGVIRVLHEPPVTVSLAGGKRTECTESVTVDVRITTAAGPLHLANVQCLVLDNHDDEILLGRETLREIGIDVENMIDQLAGPDRVAQADRDDFDEEEYVLVDEHPDEIEGLLEAMLRQAEDEGFDAVMLPRMKELVYEFRDVWRVQLGADEPADVTPMEVQLRDDAVPYRSGTRKYPERQREFLRRYVRELEANGLIVRNNASRWACAAHPVKKQGSDDYRITVDYRPVNERTVPLAGATPNLAAVTQGVRGAYGFGTFDFFKGFWQLPLHEDSREMFSFVTEDGVFTPARVPQGAADSALHFQLQMHEVFREQLYDSVLVWIDDVLLFANSAADFIDRLRVFFQILRQRRLKLNARKCKLFAPRVIWCGKLVDGEGIQHDPARLEALRNVPLPPTAAALQGFLCAVNWLRESMVDYARVVGPLQAKLESVMATRGRKKKQLTGVDLSWTKEDEDAFRMVLRLLTTSTKMYFADPSADVCLFTDASNVGWAVVLTQVKDWKPNTPVVEQTHELLVCRAGLFKGAETNWSVIEKEAYPVVRACSDLAYLLEREKGFRIYCDHANLVEVFAPHREIKAHVRGKLQRWALKIVGARYTIEHIKGEDNVWADMVSRWAGPQEPATVKRTTSRSAPAVSDLRPLQDPGFRWPEADEIRRAQARARADAPTNAVERDGLLCVGERVWLPTDARDLVQRIMVVAHCGLQGHRGEHVMLEVLQQHFELVRMRATISRFVRGCLLCKHVKGGKIIQREWDPAPVATQRNERLHMDYLYLGDSYGNSQYVLVLKDELTHFCELVAADSPTSLTAAESVLDWNKRYGLPAEWVSDNGSHFKATLMDDLASRVHARHRFVPVYTPWINGTVERVNRDLLQVLRVLLLELQLDTRNWVHLLPVIQANINHTPVPSLGGHAPIELFTGLPAPTPLDAVVLPGTRKARVLTVDLAAVDDDLRALREHLAAMHADTADRKEKKRLYEMAKQKGQICNFEVGDYVLWSRVDKRLQGGKLLVRWVGPFRVQEALPHSFRIKHLLSGDVYDVHASRLKFYYEPDLNVTAEIRQHIGQQGIILEVRAVVAHRRSRVTGGYELYVAWRGLEDEENSWEPFGEIQRGAPQLVRRYVEEQNLPDLMALVPAQSDQ